jgi:hypothetical protein
MKKALSKEEIMLTAVTIILLIGYWIVNWDTIFQPESVFLLTTVGVFMWLVLVVLFLNHSVVQQVRRELSYTIEDNIVEIKLLKDLTEKQLEESQIISNTIDTITRKPPVQRRAAPKKAPAKKVVKKTVKKVVKKKKR